MHAPLVWLVFAVACVVLGFVGYHFSVRTLRFVTALFVSIRKSCGRVAGAYYSGRRS
jgi:hypothetical protein